MLHYDIIKAQYENQYLEAMLTDRFIRSAKEGIHSDGNGLYLQVYPSGNRAFVFRDQTGGKQKKEVLGRYPAMGLADARQVAAKRKSGLITKTLAVAFSSYYEHLKTQFRDPKQTKRMFDKDVLPKVGASQLDELSRMDYTALLDAIKRRGSPTMANRTLTQLKRFLEYCEDKGWVDNNPLEKVKRKSIGGKEKPKDRNLSLGEIGDFIGLLRGLNNLSDGTRWALYGCLLTGQRASEVLGVSATGVVRTKMDRDHQIPLTPHVRAWLKIRPTELPRDHRVLSHALRRLEQTFTPHDLRRTFATRLADMDVLPHVIEKLLDHQMVGVMAVYNRATYWPERKAAQRLWGKTLRSLRHQSQVTEEQTSAV
jgi:integrase